VGGIQAYEFSYGSKSASLTSVEFQWSFNFGANINLFQNRIQDFNH